MQIRNSSKGKVSLKIFLLLPQSRTLRQHSSYYFQIMPTLCGLILETVGIRKGDTCFSKVQQAYLLRQTVKQWNNTSYSAYMQTFPYKDEPLSDRREQYLASWRTILNRFVMVLSSFDIVSKQFDKCGSLEVDILRHPNNQLHWKTSEFKGHP